MGVQRDNLMDALPCEAEQLANRVERFTVRSAFGPAPAAPEPENRCVSLRLRERQPVMNVAANTLGLKRLFAFVAARKTIEDSEDVLPSPDFREVPSVVAVDAAIHAGIDLPHLDRWQTGRSLQTFKVCLIKRTNDERPLNRVDGNLQDLRLSLWWNCGRLVFRSVATMTLWFCLSLLRHVSASRNLPAARLRKS